MHILELVKKLNTGGIVPYLQDGRLKTKSSKTAMTKEMVGLIKAHKDELVAFLSKADAEPGLTQQIPKSARDRGRYPLSFAQQRLWFIDRMNPGDASYNVGSALLLSGPLDVDLVCRCFAYIVQRHEVLRCCYFEDDDGAWQKPRQQDVSPVTVKDLSAIPGPQARAEVEALAINEAQRPFSLADDDMLRVSLVKLPPEGGQPQHALLLNMHHIASDGWSMGVVSQEFVRLYDTLRNGGDINSALTPLPIQYIDFACWQREHLSGQQFHKQLDYWVKRLDNVPTVHSLVLDRPRPAMADSSGGQYHLTLPCEILNQLNALAQSQGATLFMLLQTAFALLLARFSRESDIVMGTPVAGRQNAAVEPLIGFFVNTLVLRTEVDLAKPFIELLSHNKTAVLDAFAHQDIPFETLVEKLKPQRSTSHSPLFQIMFALQNQQDSGLNLPGLSISPLANGAVDAKFEITFVTAQTADGLLCHCSYATSVFDHESMVNLTEAYGQLLRSIVAQPQCQCAQLALLSDEKIAHLKADQPPVLKNVPQGSMLQLFDRQVTRLGQKTAIVNPLDGSCCSYSELEQMANRIAHYLTASGVGPADIVAIYQHRSIRQIASMLAVLKLQATFVALDVTSPISRVQYIVEDSEAVVMLGEQSLVAQLTLERCKAICMDDEKAQAAIAGLSDTRPGPIAQDGTQVAYIIYTSGSTGQPKGSMISHNNVLHLLSQQSYFVCREDDVFSQMANVAFDAAMFEIWCPLSSGATLVLVDKDTYIDPHRLARLYAEHGVNVSFVTTAVFNQVATVLPDAFSRLRVLMFGGEQEDTGAINRVIAHGKPTLLLHMYGPSECTTYATWYEIKKAQPYRYPIGRCLDGFSGFVVEPDGQLSVPGMPGELWLGGPGVSLGYFNRPELTAKAFVTKALLCDTVLYKTGDLVRTNSDGELVYLARSDDQVKLRGFRIELGEINSVLSKVDAVDQALVMVCGSGEGRFLAAYIATGVEDRQALLVAVKSKVAAKLPQYMWPSAYMCLDKLPVNANGKVDKKALPEPVLEDLDTYVAPETELQQTLCGLFGELLNIDPEQISVESSFFNLGGHSLLATRLVSRISVVCSVKLPLHKLFECPSVRQLAELLQQSSMQDLAQDEGSIPKAGDDEPRLLSFSQQRLWFIDRMEGASAQYNIQAPMRFVGHLDVTALGKALNALVARHQVLASVYLSERLDDGQTREVQQYMAGTEVPLKVVDCRSMAKEDAYAEALKLLQQDALTPFDLESDCMLRAMVVQLPDNEVGLVINQHHIASDGWSSGILFSELSALYEAALNGQALNNLLPPLPIQYCDFALWQRKRLSGEVLSRQLDHWTRQLAGIPQVHHLLLDYPRPVIQSFEGGVFNHQIDSAQLSRLKALAQQQQVTLFMLLQSAFAALIGRFSGESDIVIGSPVAGREHADLEHLVGFFINNLILRTDVAFDQPFSALLKQAKETILAAFDHQQVPFEMLVEVLQPDRSTSYNPLFQIGFALQNLELREFTLSGLTPVGSEPDDSDGLVDFAKYDINLSCYESDDGLQISWSYAKALFKPATIKRMAHAYELLLCGIVENVDQIIGCYDLVGAEQRQWLLHHQGDKVTPVYDGLLHQWFEQQVIAAPEAVALIADDFSEQLSYGELNRRANIFAHHLLRQGIPSQSLVAILMPRGLDVSAAILGCLKAGMVLIPLDPNYPEDRIRFMLDDADIRYIATQSCLIDSLPADGRVLLAVSDIIDHWQAEVDDPKPQQLGLNLDSLAYGIYSSGSTGQPKVSVTPHRGICNLVDVSRRLFELSAQTVCMQFASLAFDASNWEWIIALTNGGRLVLISDETRQDPVKLDAVAKEHQLTHALLPPALLPSLDVECWQSMQGVLVGGEDTPLAYAKTWAKGRRLFNAYGPSEASICNAVGVFAADDSVLTIGKAIDNTTAYVFNEQLQLQPFGVVGELYIGGIGLARHYLNRPQLNAERFIDNPYEPGSRLYKTGDLVRLLDNGEMLFVGRSDDQVKLRGFRIELGEIEAALNNLPEIEEALVMVTGEGADKALVAYIVSSACPETLVAQTKDALAGTLPHFMVPSGFVVLDQMPLTPNGKIDRRALQAMECMMAQQVVIAPRNDIEEQLRGMWAQTLSLPQESIGVTVNFFNLGGHSLMAARLINQINDQWSLSLSVRAIFDHGTIAELADHLRRQQTQIHRRIVAQGKLPDWPLSYAQQRLWTLDRLEGGSVQYNMPFGFIVEGLLHLDALELALKFIVERHQVLRSVYFDRAGESRQRLLAMPERLVEVIDCTGSMDAFDTEVKHQQQLEAQTPFDLSNHVMLRAKVVLGPEHRQALLVTLHHIAGDGWSMGVLTRELVTAYGAFSQEQTPQLAPMTVQYGDFALWQHEPEQLKALDAQLDYWKEQLNRLPSVHNLPTDRPRPAQQQLLTERVIGVIDQALTARVERIAARLHCSVFMILNAALSIVLARLGGEDDIVLGTPIAGRQHAELEGLIGCFINSLVLRHQVDWSVTGEDWLLRCKDTILDAFSHQDVSFEMLVEQLQPERSLAYTPLFQVMLVMQNNPVSELSLSGVSLTPLVAELRIGKYDLNISVTPHEGQLLMSWQYALSLFDQSTIERFSKSFALVLDGLTEDLSRPLAQLEVVSEDERQQLDRFNDTAIELARDKAVSELIIEQGLSSTEAVAVRESGKEGIEETHYGKLLSMAASMQQQLVAAGERVAIYTPPGAGLLAAILAVLNSGRSYVPIELKSTPDRIDKILEDADIDTVLLCPSLKGNISDKVNQIFIDKQAKGQSIQLMDVDMDASAYAIYTSGSTGIPKGVDVPHSGLADYCAFATEGYYRGQSQACGSWVVTSHGFDITVPSLFVPLLHGDCVDFLPQDSVLEHLAQRIREPAAQGVLLRMTPSHVRGLLALLEPGFHVDSPHVFVIGGEGFPVEDAVALQRHFPKARVINHYGPSEAVVGCTWWDVSQVIDNGQIERFSGVLPIGKPMHNTKAYVVNEAGLRQPLGGPGELWISGRCVTKGYIKRPELSKEKFLSNPFEPEGEYGRVYRTGDLVKMLPDGVIAFLGRGDEQVKIRGFRVELGEVEAAIVQCAGVEDVAVVQPQGQSGLAAFIVTNTSCCLGQLKMTLQAILPLYMVPDWLMTIDAIPLSANGKVNRKQLSQMPLSKPERQILEAKNPLQQRLVAHWAEVLGADPTEISCDDNFFAVGGNSVGAISLVARLNRTEQALIDQPLKANELFAAPTIVRQAQLLENRRSAQSAQLQCLQPADEPAQTLFLVHPIGGDVACYSALVAQLPNDWAVYGFEHPLLGEENIEVLAIDTLAERYIKALNEVQSKGPVLLLGWSMGGVIALTMARQLVRLGREVAYVGAIDSDFAPLSEALADLAQTPDLAWQQAKDKLLDAGQQALFDNAYQVPMLATLAGCEVKQMRMLLAANFVAARAFQETLLQYSDSIDFLHYMAANHKEDSLREIRNTLKAMARKTCLSDGFEGDHFSLLQPPLVARLAADIVHQIKVILKARYD